MGGKQKVERFKKKEVGQNIIIKLDKISAKLRNDFDQAELLWRCLNSDKKSALWFNEVLSV